MGTRTPRRVKRHRLAFAGALCFCAAEASGDAIRVTIIGGPKGESPQALYSATVSSAGALVGETVRLQVPEPLTEFEAGEAAARRFAIASGFEPCSKAYNTVVLPETAGSRKSWVAYLLPGTTRNDIIPMGGTHRIEVDWKAETAVFLIVTHHMDAVPTEAHVFWSLWAAQPSHRCGSTSPRLPSPPRSS